LKAALDFRRERFEATSDHRDYGVFLILLRPLEQNTGAGKRLMKPGVGVAIMKKRHGNTGRNGSLDP
jgi:hypothetical protein